MKVTVERKAGKPEFKVGELVELDRSQFDDGLGYMVMVSKSNPTSFDGVIMQSDIIGDNEFNVGEHSKGFHKLNFIKFTGKLILEQQ
jgi:hypothetical protein